MEHEDKLLNEREACRFLSVSRSYLARRRMEGADPVYVKLGVKAVRYRVSDLLAYIDSSRRSGRAERA